LSFQFFFRQEHSSATIISASIQVLATVEYSQGEDSDEEDTGEEEEKDEDKT
jgi:hypothetical protein